MFSSHVLKHFGWGTVLTAGYLLNRMPPRVLKFQSPYQLLLQTFPHVNFFPSNISMKFLGALHLFHPSV